jgi:alpha-beta hydrolase superfamily lysophospholipase
MRRRLIRILLILLLFPPALAAVGGWFFGPAFLHPIRRELTPDLLREADATFGQIHAHREDFDVRAPDGVLLRGWKVRPVNPNGSWVVLFHGVADNRMGVLEHARVLLLAGYGVVMMDARAHGASEGPIATYGWLERNDTRAIVDALLALESDNWRIRVQFREPPNLPRITPFTPPPLHLFALGESMGAGIALQSAGADPRVEAVVAESSFANLQEAAYDYAGLRKSPLLGKTLLAPGTWTLLYRGEKLAGIPLAEVSPVKAVASRDFPVLLICDEKDDALPCRHTQMIYDAALGSKELWVVPGAYHTAALGFYPEEFKRRVLSFFAAHANSPASSRVLQNGVSSSFVPRVSSLGEEFKGPKLKVEMEKCREAITERPKREHSRLRKAEWPEGAAKNRKDRGLL